MVLSFKESHEKDFERLTADRRLETESKEAHTLPNASKHTVMCMKGLISLDHCGLSACFRWWPGIPTSAWNEANRARHAILAFGMQHGQCLDVNLSPDISTRPISKITTHRTDHKELVDESEYSRTRHKSDPHHLEHRLISLRGGFWKNQFRTSRMTTSDRKSSFFDY